MKNETKKETINAPAEKQLVNPYSPKLKSDSPFLNYKTINKKWILIDLEGLVLGRVSSYVASVLAGKNKPTYSPHVDCGDSVILINAEKVAVTGKKETDKIYYHHTGYPGGIKARSLKLIRSKKPENIVIQSIKTMLGRGPLAYKQMTRLHVYAGDKHEHQAQMPVKIDFASLNRKNLKTSN